MRKVKEKYDKVLQYLKLRHLFAKDSEFRRIHPELTGLWEKKFRQMIRYSSDRTFPIAEEFLTVKIEKVSDKRNTNAKQPILICALKNEIDKIQYFMEYYRKLGVEDFVFLDNMSTDGTLEYLIEQEGTAVYRCEHSFTADRKIAWINRLIAECGDDHWYLMVDSDEFVTYIGAAKHEIKDLLDKCRKNGYKRLGGAMLDMYPKENLFGTEGNVDFLQKYCYLDRDTYLFSKAANGIRIVGGPRTRVFGTKMKLSKFCLFYFEKDDVIPSAHFLIPFEKSYEVPTAMAILHYKFVNESDYEKMVEAVETGMHSDNSAEYKTYYNGMKNDPKLTFYDEEHSMPITEENLKRIDFLDDIFGE